ncbi:MAG: serine hydroxymethyltransferase [Thermoplasmata archaeon]
MKEDVMYIRNLLKEHNKWFEECLPMIASENIVSPYVKEALISDFGDRYAEGLPGERYYQGCPYIDKVELKAQELGRKLFNAPYVDVRPISGTVANLAVLFSLVKPGDKISAPNVSDGAHISSAKFGAVGVRGLEPVTYPWDRKNMNIDVDGTIRLIKQEKPKLCLFGQSVFLFPTPLKDIMDAVKEVNANVWYDAAHVLGLIAGGQFQDPLREGVDVISGSTHKTFYGPQRGIIIADPKERGMPKEKMLKKLTYGVFPGVLSNHHLHTMAGLGIAMAEFMEFGREYAAQVVKNAQALGQALYDNGFDVLCPHLGFTKSHTLALDVKKLGGATKIVEDLEKANVITNKNLLPWDSVDDALNPSGIRLGVQELTRVGMKESEMKEVADIFKNLAIDKKPIEEVKQRVKELKRNFTKVKYCYTPEAEAYKFYELVN